MRISDWSSDVCSSDLELDGDWLEAVVAGEPHVFVEGGRPLYDFAKEAALLQPCALLHLAPESMAQPLMRASVEPQWALRCASVMAAALECAYRVDATGSQFGRGMSWDSGWTYG